MYRIAVVTPEPESDAISRQLLAVRRPAARLEALDPGTLRAIAADGCCQVAAGRPDVRWDALILRRLSRDASQDGDGGDVPRWGRSASWRRRRGSTVSSSRWRR